MRKKRRKWGAYLHSVDNCVFVPSTSTLSLITFKASPRMYVLVMYVLPPLHILTLRHYTVYIIIFRYYLPRHHRLLLLCRNRAAESRPRPRRRHHPDVVEQKKPGPALSMQTISTSKRATRTKKTAPHLIINRMLSVVHSSRYR